MKIFKNNNSSKHKKKIDYLEEEETDYESFIPWKNSFAGNNFFEWMRSKFEDFQELQLQGDKNIVLFKNESTFAFRINTDVLNITPSIIWNYWKDEILDAGYVLKNSETEYQENQISKRYYLKPRLKYKMEQQQRYGNITLELLKSKSTSRYIVMKCTWYVDQNFKKPDSFEELFKTLTL